MLRLDNRLRSWDLFKSWAGSELYNKRGKRTPNGWTAKYKCVSIYF